MAVVRWWEGVSQDFLRMREFKKWIVKATAKAPTSNAVLIIGRFQRHSRLFYIDVSVSTLVSFVCIPVRVNESLGSTFRVQDTTGIIYPSTAPPTITVAFLLSFRCDWIPLFLLPAHTHAHYTHNTRRQTNKQTNVYFFCGPNNKLTGDSNFNR